MAIGPICAAWGLQSGMDSRAHEATYYGFIQFAEIGTAVVICHVLALAVGGIKHAWLTAIFGVILSLVAGGIGAMAPSVGVRARPPSAFFSCWRSSST